MAEDVLKPVSPGALSAFDAVRAKVEEEVLIRCLTEDAPQQTMGPNAEAMIKSGLGFVSRMLRAAMSFSAGEILADEMEWGKTHLPECGVSTLMVMRNFDRYLKALSESMPQEALEEIRPYIENMLAGQRGIIKAANHENMAMKPGDDGFYDDLSRLNNELINLQREMAKRNAELRNEKEKAEKLSADLAESLRRVKRLEGIIPICMHCRRIRDDQESWQEVVDYITDHSDAMFSHSLCPDCEEKFYPGNGAKEE